MKQKTLIGLGLGLGLAVVLSAATVWDTSGISHQKSRGPASATSNKRDVNFNKLIQESRQNQENIADSMKKLYNKAEANAGDHKQAGRVLEFVEVEMKWQKEDDVVETKSNLEKDSTKTPPKRKRSSSSPRNPSQS